MAEGLGVSGSTREIDKRQIGSDPLLRDHVGTVERRAARTQDRIAHTGLMYGDTIFVDAGGVLSVNEPNMALANIGGVLPITKGGTGEVTAEASFDALADLGTKGEVILGTGDTEGPSLRLTVGGDGSVLMADAAEPCGVKWGEVVSLPVIDTTYLVFGSDPHGGNKTVRIDASLVGGSNTGPFIRVLTMADKNIDLTPDTGSFQSPLPVVDTTSVVKSSSSNKQVKISTGAISSSTTRTITMPDRDVDLGKCVISDNEEGSAARMTRQTSHEALVLSGSPSDTTGISIPLGARLLGVSMNVNAAVVATAGDGTWSAAFTGGSTTTIATGVSSAQDQKVDFIVPDEKTTGLGLTQIRFTPHGGNFSAGTIEIVAYYEELTSLEDV